jgi:hypothetical protein
MPLNSRGVKPPLEDEGHNCDVCLAIKSGWQRSTLIIPFSPLTESTWCVAQRVW